MLIATHSPIVASIPGASILEFDAEGVHQRAWTISTSWSTTAASSRHPSATCVTCATRQMAHPAPLGTCGRRHGRYAVVTHASGSSPDAAGAGWCHPVSMADQPGQETSGAFARLQTKPRVASGQALLVSMLVLLGCDVIGGFVGVASGAETWGTAWGFDTHSTVPFPMGVVQLVLAWLAARDVRPPVGLVAAVVLSAVCLISVLAGFSTGTSSAPSRPTGCSPGASSGQPSCCWSPQPSACSPRLGRGSCTHVADTCDVLGNEPAAVNHVDWRRYAATS